MEKLPSVSEEANKKFESARTGYGVAFDDFMDGVKIAIKDMCGDSWKRYSDKSKVNILQKKIFDSARVKMNVPTKDAVGDGTGIPYTTFMSWCTWVKRMMIFHCTISDAKRHANYALKDAFEKACAKPCTEGTLEQRMTKTLDQCRNDPDWVGNPQPVRNEPAKVGDGEHGTNQPFQLPPVGVADNPRELMRLGIDGMLAWFRSPKVKHVLQTSDDPAIKKVYVLYGQMIAIMEELDEEIKMAV
jgi:hypothetical protein